MAGKAQEAEIYFPDSSFDWSGGVDSSKVTTLQSERNPNGLGRNQLAWLVNGSLREGGISQRYGWQPLIKEMMASGFYWQGGFLYQPDSANPFLVCVLSGVLYAGLLDPPYTVVNLTTLYGVAPFPSNPAIAPACFFAQAENYLVIQAGDFYTQPGIVTINSYGQPLAIPSSTLPLFWSGVPAAFSGYPGSGTGALRPSMGITSLVPTISPGINEIPGATCMCFYGQHLWYSQGRSFSAGDTDGAPSGTQANHYRDAVLAVTENPLCFGGFGFSLPTASGNIRAMTYAAAINVPQGQGQFFICTRKNIYSLVVPANDTDWINATAANQPVLNVMQLTNGPVGDRVTAQVNGDVFYQSFTPDIRSLIIATRYFQQWANTSISQNEARALDGSNRALMQFSSAVEFDNRLLNLVLPTVAPDGVNTIHEAILPLDFDDVGNLSGESNPVWEGAHGGVQALQIFSGDFGGLPRCFVSMISSVDGSLGIWEITNYSLTENGDNRVPWSFETPSFTWASSRMENDLKILSGGELWLDEISGTVDLDFYYRQDADPCWHFWTHTSVCSARCGEQEPVIACYPPPSIQAGYRFPVRLPSPKGVTDSQGIRPSNIAYQFQMKVVLKGYCRVRGYILYAQRYSQTPYQGVSCPTTSIPQGMAKLPDPFNNNPFPAP